ncbi:hypothetical protein KIW84_053410 [Lathyrus oleraceus]|uniref:Uncharacterized protein n=1 Tax=Pisum sativum TaxID=3888 RepID=A0A9D4WSX0_PEA|nr:hypothetical protein KIW84_053410 [Pisum sativum]
MEILTYIAPRRNLEDELKWIRNMEDNFTVKSYYIRLMSNAKAGEESSRLEEMFSTKEIKGVVFDCEGNKSPGPNGFNMEFLRRCWEVVGYDVVECIQEFHYTAKLPKVMVSSFLALIPKSENP